MSDGSMPFFIEDLPVRHQNLTHRAIVITPKNSMVLGRERIEALRRPTSLNKVDRWLIDQAVQRSGKSRMILFRACNRYGERVWQFDPSLSDAELEEAGYLLTCALVPFHRRLLNAGVVLMVHTDWGVRECYAMRHGVRKFENELSANAASLNKEVQTVDRWLLNNMLLHVALSIDHVTQRLLPLHLGMIDRRWEQLEHTLRQLPPDAVA